MKNKYEIREDVTAIFLSNKKGEEYETLIDTEDLAKVREQNLSWHLKWDKVLEQYYCKATKYLGVVEGKYKYQTIHLHALVVDFKMQHIDHKNHNTLDNRKSNLIDTTAQKNLFNRIGANKNTSTGVRNVSFCKTTGKYLVQLQINRKNVLFGRFKELEDAILCAEENRAKYYTNEKYL
ncbi:hypothetical protein [Bacillus sp. FJAT-22090]|uniref:hypothetical protein n=1 Tax=Bacillus sp. FJAT-22090 TaxID=1581038 RepID=UPI0011A59249|nr:hypothetical protein [Bacillus sp. FJAT-22090]